MIRKHSVVLAALSAAAVVFGMTSAAWAQAEAPTGEVPKPHVTMVFEADVVDGREFARVLTKLVGDRIQIGADDTGRSVIVSGPEALALAIGELLQVAPLKHPPEEAVTKFVNLEHADPERVLELLGPVLPPDVTVSHAGRNLNTMAVSGPPHQTAPILEAIERLDVPEPPEPPKKNIELTVYLLLAVDEAGRYADDGVPPLLNDVIEQLREAFAFESFRLWDTFFIRCRDGEEAEASWMIPGDESGTDSELGPTILKVQADAVQLQRHGDGNSVRIDNLIVGAEVPVASGVQTTNEGRRTVSRVSRHDMRLKTAVDVREGQKVVVGKANVAAPSGDALFVVVTAKSAD